MADQWEDSWDKRRMAKNSNLATFMSAGIGQVPVASVRPSGMPGESSFLGAGRNAVPSGLSDVKPEPVGKNGECGFGVCSSRLSRVRC